MIQIDEIEIYSFRSIVNLKLKGLKDITILSGKNDSGKSNVLKALNLFFNNETDWKTQLDFIRDFSLKRRFQLKDKIKGRECVNNSV